VAQEDVYLSERRLDVPVPKRALRVLSTVHVAQEVLRVEVGERDPSEALPRVLDRLLWPSLSVAHQPCDHAGGGLTLVVVAHEALQPAVEAPPQGRRPEQRARDIDGRVAERGGEVEAAEEGRLEGRSHHDVQRGEHAEEKVHRAQHAPQLAQRSARRDGRVPQPPVRRRRGAGNCGACAKSQIGKRGGHATTAPR
jgi:hypothetical protein